MVARHRKAVTLVQGDIQRWETNVVVEVMNIQSAYFTQVKPAKGFKFLKNLVVKGLDKTMLFHISLIDKLENLERQVLAPVALSYIFVFRDFQLNIDENIFVRVRKNFVKCRDSEGLFVHPVFLEGVLKNVLLRSIRIVLIAPEIDFTTVAAMNDYQLVI